MSADTAAPRIAAGSVFVAAVVLIAAVAAWPIYRDPAFVLLAAVSALTAAAIAALAATRGWGGWPVAGLLAGAFVVLGIPLAVPTRLGSPAEYLRGFVDLAAGAVLGWKDLVTVDLPVGTYRNLLVPALLVFLVGTCVALLLAWRSSRAAYGAVAVAGAMISFGLLFGRTSVSDPLVIGSLRVPAPVESALGVAGLLAALLWLVWRGHDERARALRRATASSGVRLPRRGSPTDRRRTALGAGMLAVAVAASALVVPWAAQGASRDVLRTAAGPELAIAEAVSPLAEYRGLFSDDRAEAVLFTVTSDGALPDRVRLATLDAYDGEMLRTGEGGASSRFVRVPAGRDAGEGTPARARIEIGALEGVWMPSVGRLVSAGFEGPRAALLADGFYYRADAGAAVQTADGGWAPGDAYEVSAVIPPAPDLAEAEAPGGAVSDIAAPENLRAWVDEHAAGTGGAALAGLAALLRDRGYLSHGLEVDPAEPPTWVRSLPDYRFQPSTAGHSLARIDAMFQRLRERESDPRARASDNFVAAVGDDEQFATAVALIANELGFPARVVLGARLQSTDPQLPTCPDGSCRAQDLAAWTEVLSADGAWIPVDATPQYAQSPSLEVTEQQNPENVTEVRPDPVRDVVPPDPVQEDTGTDEQADAATGPDLAWLWPVLRIAGIVLLVLLLVAGPFAVVVAAKASRRRGRRTRGTPAARIAGGWEEYVDAAVDAGREARADLTRTELAAVLAGTGAATGAMALAREADRAVFSDRAVSSADAEAYWQAVDRERRAVRRGRGVWRDAAATVSLRSFVRHLAPSGSRSRTSERGKRRLVHPRRVTS